jgi:hypothetical protein
MPIDGHDDGAVPVQREPPSIVGLRDPGMAPTASSQVGMSRASGAAASARGVMSRVSDSSSWSSVFMDLLFLTDSNRHTEYLCGRPTGHGRIPGEQRPRTIRSSATPTERLTVGAVIAAEAGLPGAVGPVAENEPLLITIQQVLIPGVHAQLSNCSSMSTCHGRGIAILG